MCGRFAITLPPEAMVQMFDAVPGNDLPDVPDYNVCPTDTVHVVRADENGRRLVSMRWGFLPAWYKTPTDGPLLINARADTVAEKPAFRTAIRERRCVIPASGFYEWTVTPDKVRLPWYIARTDGEPILFAGLWQEWERDGQHLVTCAIVTTDANGPMSRIHHRMPVVLDPADVALWLGEAGKGAALLMKPAPDDAAAAGEGRSEGELQPGRGAAADRAGGLRGLRAVAGRCPPRRAQDGGRESHLAGCCIGCVRRSVLAEGQLVPIAPVFREAPHETSLRVGPCQQAQRAAGGRGPQFARPPVDVTSAVAR